MPLFKRRRKTTRTRRDTRSGGDLHTLHIKVTSPRIVMFQLLGGMGKLLKISLCLALLGMICWGGWLGLQKLFLDNEKYTLHDVMLETNGHLTKQDVLEALGIENDPNIFTIDTSDAKQTLLALPEVMDAEVQYHLPEHLKVTIVERVPVVWIECQERGYPGRKQAGILADKDGITFPCVPSFWQAYRDLPVVVAKGTDGETFKHGSKMKHKDSMRAISLLESFKKSSCRAQWLPERIILVNDYSLEAICNDGSRAVFGMYDHERQLQDFITIRERAEKTQRMVAHINLIPKINIPVRFEGDAVLIKPRRKPTQEETFTPHQREIHSILNR